jgi:hypothetical protein
MNKPVMDDPRRSLTGLMQDPGAAKDIGTGDLILKTPQAEWTVN